MANTLRFKRGLLASLPSAAVGEPLFTTDTFDLYIGTASGTQKYQKFIASGTTSQLLRGDGSLLTMPIVLSSPANGEVLKYNGTNWVNSSDAGITGSGVAGQVAYFTGATTQGGSNNLFWDASNNRLGIGTNGPTQALTVIGIISASTEFRLNNQSFTRVAISDTGGGFAGGYNLALSGGITPVHDSTGAISGVHYHSGGTVRFYTNSSQAAGTTATERMRLHSTGNLHLGGTSDSGQRLQVTGDGYFSGSVGIGQTAFSGSNFRISKTLTGSASAINFYIDSVIQSDVTNSPKIIATTLSTQAAAFTIPIVSHFYANQGSIGAGSAITTQIGFQADNTLTGATNNYGFYGNIPSGTGRWNLYMNGLADNYIAANLLLGTTTNPDGHKLFVNGGRGFFNNGIRLGTGYSAIDVVTGASGLYLSGAQGALNHVFINPSGNLGLGVTPSAWHSGVRAMQVGLASSIASRTGGSGLYIGDNYYFSTDPSTGPSTAIYLYSAAAATYRIASGQHQWYNAPSGTAGNAITFTQAMTLDASGNLAVGTTTTTNRLEVWGSGNTAARIVGQSAGNATLILSSGGVTAYSIKSGNGDSSLRIDQDGSERIMLASGGNLLIGSTSNSGEKLQVTGTAKITSTITAWSGFSTYTGDGLYNANASSSKILLPNSGNEIRFGYYSAGDGIYHGRIGVLSNSNDKVSFGGFGANTFTINTGTANTERFRIDANGNVGIGVTPSAWSVVRGLQVGLTASLGGYASSTEGMFLSSNSFYNGGAFVYQVNGNATQYLQISGTHRWSYAASGTAGNNITFTEAMRLDASGNLGIGTTSPRARLHTLLNGNASNGITGTTLIGQNSSSGNSSYLTLVGAFDADAGIVFTDESVAYKGRIVYSNNNEFMSFWTDGSERSRIFSTGNIAIGSTTDSGEKLQVTGTAKITGAATFSSSVTAQTGLFGGNLGGANQRVANFRNSGGNAFIELQSSGAGAVALWAASANEFGIYQNATAGTIGTNVFYITSAANIGIGTFTPSYKLDVNGTFGATGAATFSSSVTANGNLFVGTQAFSIDVASNRVAINKSSPTRRLDIGGTVGDFQVYDSGAEVYFTRNANNDIYADGGTSAGLTLGGRSYLAFKTGTASLTERMRLDASGNLGIGGTPAQRLDVQGSANSIQARFGNVAGRGLTIGTSAISGTNDAGVIFNAPTATDGTLIFQTTSVERARISGSGNLLINTTSDTGYKLRVNGTSYFDDNLRFPNLKGCVFVQTGGTLLGSIAMDSANAVTIDNNGFAGLSVGGSYTMTGGNLGIGHSAFGTSATKTISVNSGTAPSTSPADAFQLYSADITAGNAAPHFRTENGGIIKLYQQTTGVTSATYIGGAGTTVTDLDTFDGYTIPQIVKALRNAGLLA